MIPNFIDLQVNGYGGCDFNQDDLSPDAICIAPVKCCGSTMSNRSWRRSSRKISTGCAARLANLVRLRERDPLAKQLIAGFHIEGPFISEAKGFSGAIRPMRFGPRMWMPCNGCSTQARGLTRMVTLAPECDAGFKVISMLAKQGVRISAGHCDPTLDQLRGAIDAGLSMFTHLGNGCPMQLHRHDNIIQRVLSLADKLLIGFIADGTHVPFFALKNYLKIAGVENCYVVTDAIAPAGLGPGRYTLGRWDLLIEEDMVAR